MPIRKLYADYYDQAVRHTEKHYNLKDDQAEQIVIDAFLALHHALERTIEIKFPLGFLHRQIKIKMAQYLRDELLARRGGTLTKHSLTERNLPTTDPNFDAVDARDTVEAVWHKLTETEQQIATAVLINGDTQYGTAIKLNLTLRTLERRLRRLRLKLRILFTQVMEPDSTLV